MQRPPSTPPRPLIAPTLEEWAAMSAAEREQFLQKVLAAHSRAADRAAAEALTAKARAAETLAAANQALLVSVRRSILLLLEVRQLAVADAVRAEVLGCADAATLDRWLGRAATVADARDVTAP